MNGLFDGVLHTFPLLVSLLASFWAIPGLMPVDWSCWTSPDDSCIKWLWYGCPALRDPFLRRLRLGPEHGDRYSDQRVVLDCDKSRGRGGCICIGLVNGCGVERGWSVGTNVAGSLYMTMMIEVCEVYEEFQNEASFYIQVLVFHLRHLLCSIYSQYPCRMTPLFLRPGKSLLHVCGPLLPYECMNESS